MRSDWKGAFRFAIAEADRLGLEFAIASSPGFSETGGPWVKPQDALKKLVWSETDLAGGGRLVGRLVMPPTVTGPFQSLLNPADFGETPESVQAARYYGDVAVLAYPVGGAAAVLPTARDGAGRVLDARLLVDSDMDAGVTLMREKGGAAPSIIVDYAAPRTVQAVSIFVKGAAVMFVGPLYTARLEASDDGKGWRTISDVPLARVPSTVAFAPVTARQFRVTFSPIEKAGLSQGLPAPGVAVDVNAGFTSGGVAPLSVADFRLFDSPRIDRYEAKAGFDLAPDSYALATSAPDLAGVAPASVIDLTSRLRPDGFLDWKAPRLPAGSKWRVLRLGYSLLGTTNHPAPPEATGLEVDKFDGPAVRRYLEHYIGMYKDAAGPGMVGEKGVRALLTDSIE